MVSGSVFRGPGHHWVALKEPKLSYYTKEPILFNLYPEYGDLTEVP